MPPRKKKSEPVQPKIRGVINGAGEISEQHITDTLRLNFMPFAMVLHNSLIRFNSRSYRKLCGQASALLAEFDAMQGIQMSGAGKP